MMYIPSSNPASSIDTLGIGDLDSRYMLLDLYETGYVNLQRADQRPFHVGAGVPARSVDVTGSS